jgi:hypothetical protein
MKSFILDKTSIIIIDDEFGGFKHSPKRGSTQSQTPQTIVSTPPQMHELAQPQMRGPTLVGLIKVSFP